VTHPSYRRRSGSLRSDRPEASRSANENAGQKRVLPFSMGYNPHYSYDEPTRADVDRLPGRAIVEFGAPW